tara:strand:- start:162 stop:770 length:609 start_codon:yes stop_codon:yes gene_type:complete
MKIHRVVQMLGATTNTGKLASDMYDLNYKTYYSEREGRDIPISHMDFQHMVRAFVKLCEQEEMLDRSKHMGKTSELVKKIEDLEARDVIQYHDLHAKIAKLEELLEEKEDLLDKEVISKNAWKQSYYNECSLKGKGYVFCEIPNDTDGQEFVDTMKKYLNKESYKLRVRGQHIKPELKGTGATCWGQSISESTHMRVYVEKK